MNLHAIVSGAIGAVNPFVNIVVRHSSGYTTNPDGSRVPTYTSVNLMAQIQPMQYDDIIMTDSLQIEGLRRKIYVNGDLEGMIRVDKTGGDLVTFPDGSVWKVAVVVEHWAEWSCAICTLQNVQPYVGPN